MTPLTPLDAYFVKVQCHPSTNYSFLSFALIRFFACSFRALVARSALLSYLNFGFFVFLGLSTLPWAARLDSLALRSSSSIAACSSSGLYKPSLETLTDSTVTDVYLSSSMNSSSWSTGSKATGASGSPSHSSFLLSSSSASSSESTPPARSAVRKSASTVLTWFATSCLRLSRCCQVLVYFPQNPKVEKRMGK